MIARTVNAIRRNIVAWLALFVALTGTSLAATHYLITSTHQIKPSVLKQLRGARGRIGPIGPQGPVGKEGAAGKEGAPGKVGLKGETGLRGESVTGPKGEAGPKGEPGEKGERGTALAFAHVTAAGKVEPEGEAKGFGGAVVENPPGKGGEGVYCISGLSVPISNIVATVDAGSSVPAMFATATSGKSFLVKKEETTLKKEVCSASTQITVETWDILSKETKNAPFFIAIN